MIGTKENTGSEQQSAGMTNPDANLFCVYVYLCVGLCTHKCMCMWRPEHNLESTLIFETGPLIDQELANKLGWLASELSL